MTSRSHSPIGRTQSWVQARGFVDIDGELLLQDQDGNQRLFLELSMDPDHAQADPAAAYEQALSSMQTGLQIRLMVICWPDPVARMDFIHQLEAWQINAPPPGAGGTAAARRAQKDSAPSSTRRNECPMAPSLISGPRALNRSATLLHALHDDLDQYMHTAPLPFYRRTILEVVLLSREAREWIDAAAMLLENYGITARFLTANEVQSLAHELFNPRLD